VGSRPSRSLARLRTTRVERVVAGFDEAYALDTRYRIAHHGADFLPESAAHMQARPIDAPEGAAPVLVLEEGGLRITAFPSITGPSSRPTGIASTTEAARWW